MGVSLSCSWLLQHDSFHRHPPRPFIIQSKALADSGSNPSSFRHASFPTGFTE
jgi:hypothetical protein